MGQGSLKASIDFIPENSFAEPLFIYFIFLNDQDQIHSTVWTNSSFFFTVLWKLLNLLRWLKNIDRAQREKNPAPDLTKKVDNRKSPESAKSQLAKLLEKTLRANTKTRFR